MSKTPGRNSTLTRREALRGIAGTAALPLLPGAAVGEMMEIGRRVRSAMPTPPAPPQALNATQNATLTAMAEIILPETDTPGATSLRIPEFVDLLLAEWTTEEARGAFTAGLDDVVERARRQHGSSFAECTLAQQTEIVAGLDAQLVATEESREAWEQRRIERVREAVREGRVPAMTRDLPPDPADQFFYHCKSFVMTGYFTTETGMKQTGYSLIPGRWDGCAEIEGD